MSKDKLVSDVLTEKQLEQLKWDLTCSPDIEIDNFDTLNYVQSQIDRALIDIRKQIDGLKQGLWNAKESYKKMLIHRKRITDGMAKKIYGIDKKFNLYPHNIKGKLEEGSGIRVNSDGTGLEYFKINEIDKK